MSQKKLSDSLRMICRLDPKCKFISFMKTHFHDVWMQTMAKFWMIFDWKIHVAPYLSIMWARTCMVRYKSCKKGWFGEKQRFCWQEKPARPDTGGKGAPYHYGLHTAVLLFERRFALNSGERWEAQTERIRAGWGEGGRINQGNKLNELTRTTLLAIRDAPYIGTIVKKDWSSNCPNSPPFCHFTPFPVGFPSADFSLADAVRSR